MNSTHPSLSPEVRAEAAAWVARLHSSTRSRALEMGLKRWLEMSPQNAQAFELATEAWDIGGALPANAFPRIAHPRVTIGERRKSVFSLPHLLLAAAFAIAAIGGLFYWSQGSVVATRVGEQRMLTLEDGTHISLNTDTRLTVRYGKERRLIELAGGEALFDVAQDGQRPFIVSAGSKEVLALGTAFLVRREPHELIVTLMEGKVQIAEPGEKIDVAPARGSPRAAGILEPGERVTFREDKAPTHDRPSLEKVTAWRRGEVVFDKTTLEDAVAELNRYGEIKLAIAEPETARIRISGIFRAGDSSRFAHAVASTYGLQVNRSRSGILISGLRQE